MIGMEYLLLEIVLIFVLLLINGLFSMSELAVVSARPIRLKQRAENGDAGAQTALDLAAAPDRFLSTVQIGITLIGILSGAFGGAGVASYLSEQFKQIPSIAAYADVISFSLVVAAITYFSLIFGELLPKSFALNYPERIAAAVARPMRFLSMLATPIVWFLSAPTRFILRLFRVHAVVEPPVTDDEIKGLIAQGTEAGVFEESEQDLLESIIHLDDQRITALMTPRLEIAWFNVESSIEAVRKIINDSGYSRFPVARGSVDNIIGYAALKDLLKQQLNGEEFNLQKVIKQPLYVPETITALELLERLKVSHTHLAIIIDEFGATEGLVTMNDVLEAIVGDLATSRFSADDYFLKNEDGSYLLDGALSTSDLKDILGIKELPGEGRGRYDTLAGFVMSHLGRVPETSETFVWRGYRFEVIQMQRNRIIKIKMESVKKNQ